MTKEILQQALDALIESRDDVATCLADRQWLTGIPRYDKQIAFYEAQLVKHDAAIEGLKQALAQQEQPSVPYHDNLAVNYAKLAQHCTMLEDKIKTLESKVAVNYAKLAQHCTMLEDKIKTLESKVAVNYAKLAQHCTMLEDKIKTLESKAQQEQPASVDAYVGAREDAAIWKKRALEAEELNRKFIAEVNGPTYLGEPAQPAQEQYPLPDSLYPGSKDWMAGSYKERVEWLHGMYESAKQEIARLEAQQAQEPVMYQYRWLNPGDIPDQPESELEWKLVEVRNVYTDTIANRIDELRGYRFSGKPVYEVRPLYAAPPTQPALSDKQILDIFGKVSAVTGWVIT